MLFIGLHEGVVLREVVGIERPDQGFEGGGGNEPVCQMIRLD